MADAFVIETRGRTAGIAVRDGNFYHFFASDDRLWGLDNHRFRDLKEVHREVETYLVRRAPNGREREVDAA